jgi:hypothetical protein
VHRPELDRLQDENILADLAMRGFSINFLKLASVARWILS